MLGITANAYLIDAVIALTVCYKAAENLRAFPRLFGIEAPNLLFMVFVFGLIHGFGLSTRLQQITLPSDPELVSKILAFNVGVELGQIAALGLMIWVVRLWRGDDDLAGGHALAQCRAASRRPGFCHADFRLSAALARHYTITGLSRPLIL